MLLSFSIHSGSECFIFFHFRCGSNSSFDLSFRAVSEFNVSVKLLMIRFFMLMADCSCYDPVNK